MTTAEPNAERRGWLGTRLEHAAGALGVTTTGTPVFGWHDRTIGTRVSTADGERWLRVVAEMSYCASILRSDVINDVHASFTDLLDGPSGQVAQLAAHR